MPALRPQHALIALMLVLGGAVSAESDTDPRGDRTVNDVGRNVRVDVRLSRTVFSEGESVPVLFRVTNGGHRTVRIYPFSPEETTFRFELLDSKGKEIEENPDLRFDPNDDVVENRREKDRAREIVLEPGETYERRIYLDRHYDLRPGEYRLSGFFLPDARHDILLRSINRLRLRIEKKVSPFSFEGDEEAQATTGPDAAETVYLFLSAELSGNMKNYFKYLDLRRYVLSYELYAREYLRAPAREREVVLQRFAEYLKSSPADPLRKFQILRTVKEGPDRARVDVSAVRSAGGYRSDYTYNFLLERETTGSGGGGGGGWKIISVVAGIKTRN